MDGRPTWLTNLQGALPAVMSRSNQEMASATNFVAKTCLLLLASLAVAASITCQAPNQKALADTLPESALTDPQNEIGQERDRVTNREQDSSAESLPKETTSSDSIPKDETTPVPSGVMPTGQSKGKLVDTSKKGSIKICLESEGSPISGINMQLERVATLEWDIGMGSWKWAPEKAFSDIDMEALGANSEKELSQALAQIDPNGTRDKKTSQVKRSDENGVIVFKNLNLGLYVLNKATSKDEKESVEVSPFCVSLPSDEGDEYSYDIDATPKIALDKTDAPGKNEAPKSGSPLPKTGDESTMMAAIIVLLIALVSVLVWFVSWLVERRRLKRDVCEMTADELMVKLDCSTRGTQAKTSNKRTDVASRLALALCVVLLFGGLLFILSPQEAFAVERVNIDTSKGVSSATAFKLGLNQSPVLEMNNGTTKADFDNKTRREITAKIPSTKGSWTVSNPAKLTFNNAGTLNKRKVKVVVNIDSVTFKKGGKDTDNGFKHDTYVTIAHMATSSLYIGCRSKDSTYGVANTNNYTIKTTVTFTWADTGETIALPFIQGVYDIDQYDSNEAWEANSGFASYIVYKGTNLSQSGNKFYLSKDYGSLSGDDSKYKGGLYATTQNGTFKSTFYGANCDSQLVLYNQLMQLSPPTKSVDKASPKPGEQIEWTVEQKIGTYIKDSFTGYSSLRFSDTLDDRLEFVSAAMLEDSKDVSKTAGTLKYDENTRKLTFDFNQSWLSSMANYKGQTLRLKIITKVKKGTYGETIPNKAIVSNSNVNFETDSKVDVPKYTASGSWIPQAKKRLDGSTLKEGQFTFKLLDSSGKTIRETTNGASGEIRFEKLDYTQYDAGKTYTYTLAESKGSEPGVTYDTATYSVQVKIVDNGDETLKVTPTYEGGTNPEFVNYALTYSSAPYPTTGGPGIAFVLLGLLLVSGGLYANKKIRK